jgi:hypothetical protein
MYAATLSDYFPKGAQHRTETAKKVCCVRCLSSQSPVLPLQGFSGTFKNNEDLEIISPHLPQSVEEPPSAEQIGLIILGF